MIDISVVGDDGDQHVQLRRGVALGIVRLEFRAVQHAANCYECDGFIPSDARVQTIFVRTNKKGSWRREGQFCHEHMELTCQ